jgi:hypothetical protein
MRLPGYSAEAALASATGREAREVRPTGASSSIVPQQAFPPGRERPVVPYCDHSSVYEEQCAPCLLRRLPPSPPTIGPRFVWRESVRRCITCYDHNGQAYPFCGPCFERACDPFVRAIDRFPGLTGLP